MKRIIVLGGGLVGGFMARDLAGEPDFAVTVADADPAVGARFDGTDVDTVVADLADPARLASVIAPFDLVVGALPGALGFEALRTVIDAGKPCADISFFPENAFELDAAAKAAGVTAVVDCGVAPGLCGIVAGYEASRLDDHARLVVQVGGLPVVRRWPFEYAAVFSPIDVIEEYTRPARFVRGGAEVTTEAMDDVRSIDFDGVGTLESFVTDGLRTLLALPFKDMEERTLRYPGHVERMRFLRACGFFDKEPVDVGGQRVAPVDLTATLLFPKWQLGPDERELTVMRIEVEGAAGGRPVKRTYDLLEYRTDEGTSMARCTGLPNTVMARLIARGEFTAPGIQTPERIGAAPGMATRVLEDLAQRGVGMRVTER